MSRSVQFACFFFIAALASARLASGPTATQGPALTLATSKDSAVRFFYQPPDGEYFHVALLFRVVKRNDPRWNTAVVFDEGRTAYVPLSEMRRLMTMLAHASLRWEQSAIIERLETFKDIHSYGYGMGIKVVSANGTAKSLIPHDKICETLAPLDGALLTPRARWEFQLFRLQYHCRVPGFNPDAYPERVP